jgi:hypothetical protein
MATGDHTYSAGHHRTARLIEVLLLLGMLGLGYFATALDDTLWAGSAPVADVPVAGDLR